MYFYGKNCGRCEKCTRTLLALDALGALDKYRDVFDVDYYLSHKQSYFKTLCIQRSLHNEIIWNYILILSIRFIGKPK